MTRRVEAQGARLPIIATRAGMALLTTAGLVLTAGALASETAQPGTMAAATTAGSGVTDRAGDNDRAGTNDRAGSPVAVASDSRPKSIAFLVVDGVYNTELTAPLDVLQHIRFHSEDSALRPHRT